MNNTNYTNYKLYALKKLVIYNTSETQPTEEIEKAIKLLNKMYGIEIGMYRLLVEMLQLVLKAKETLKEMKEKGTAFEINLAHKYHVKLKDDARDLYHKIQDKQLDIVQKKLNAFMK